MLLTNNKLLNPDTNLALENIEPWKNIFGSVTLVNTWYLYYMVTQNGYAHMEQSIWYDLFKAFD